VTAFHHSFGRTVLRKYDICGIVGKTLQLEDAFAIGCCFGSMVARAGGSKVTVGYDGRLSQCDWRQCDNVESKGDGHKGHPGI
jgi:phosphomannomutase